MKTVAHFIRKSSQLKASFINNQITNHIDYNPVIIYRYHSNKDDGGFAEFNKGDISALNLSDRKKVDINFRYLKKISSKDTKRVIEFLNRHKVSILHFHYGSDACIYSDVIKDSGIPSVVSFYGYDASSHSKYLLGYGGYLLRNNLFPFISKVLAMSPDMKKDLIDIGCPKEKIIVHYYGTDVSLFKGIKRIELKEKKIIMLILASLVPQKGHLFLLKALVEIRKQEINNFHLRIVGTGELEKQLKKFTEENSISDLVTFVGAIKYRSQNMIDEFRNADIFIHPSVIAANGDKEGIPGTVIEAMASGLPVISTYHAGIPYIIKNEENGFLVKEWDVTSLVEKIKTLAKNFELRNKLGLAAQKYALVNLDLRKKEVELENIYDLILSNS